jgi:hypothetical protein
MQAMDAIAKMLPQPANASGCCAMETSERVLDHRLVSDN